MTGRRAGMAIPVVCSAILVIAILIISIQRWQAYRIKATGISVNSFSALQAAEAGVHVALAEMRRSSEWATHRVELTSSGSTRWIEPLKRTVESAGDPSKTGLLRIDDSPQGVVAGSLGKDASLFKVRAARIPLADDPTTPAIDESHRFYRIESMGFRKDASRNQDRATRIDVLAERSNFTEFLLYDREDVVLGMGSYHDQDNANVFADGWIYGRQRVHLGDAANSGTRQLFINLGKLLSDGPILVWNPFSISFQDPPGTIATLGPENDSRAGDRMETAKGNILDGNNKKPASEPTIDPEYYRKLAKAGGIDVSALEAREEKVRIFEETPKIHLDFGRAGYPGSGLAPDDAKALGQEYPPEFNGIIYSDRPLAIWGAPDRDVTIFCTKDVFVCGDFNARVEWRKRSDGGMDWVGHRQNYRPRYEPKGLKPVDGSRHFEYLDRDREVYVVPGDPTTRVSDGTEERKAVAVVSLGRVWFDLRHPSRFLANELRPYVKFRIVEALSSETAAYEWLKDGSRPKPVVDVSMKLHGKPGPALQDLFDLRRKVTEEEPRKRLYMTQQPYERVMKAFTEELVDRAANDSEKGVITKEKLEGTPEKPGLVQVVLDAMTEDEDRFGEFSFTQDQPPPLAIWSAPQGLYDLVYDERRSLGPQGYGPYSDWAGDPAREEYSRDEFFMPQMTINTLVIAGAARNDPGRTLDPTIMNRRFDELGNGMCGVHYLSSRTFLQGDRENVISPLVQRFVGSEIRLAMTKNVPPTLENGFYWPPIRRRIYDATLPFHTPPHILGLLEILNWRQSGATPADFQAFDRALSP